MSQKASDKPKAERALVSGDLARAQQRAQELAEDPEELQALLDRADAKAQSLDKEARDKGKVRRLIEQIMGLTRLVRAYTRGEYTNLPRKTLLTAIAALFYFWMPLDFVPDWLLGLGFFDDAAVAGYVFASLKDDIDQFLAWEKDKIPLQD